jgi:hypothetical protein
MRWYHVAGFFAACAIVAMLKSPADSRRAAAEDVSLMTAPSNVLQLSSGKWQTIPLPSGQGGTVIVEARGSFTDSGRRFPLTGRNPAPCVDQGNPCRRHKLIDDTYPYLALLIRACRGYGDERVNRCSQPVMIDGPDRSGVYSRALFQRFVANADHLELILNNVALNAGTYWNGLDGRVTVTTKRIQD